MIKIKKSNCADTRTCDWSKVTKEELLEQSKMHISDINKGMRFFRDMVIESAMNHDLTKISHIDDFHADFATGFKSTKWWEMHQEAERHHFDNKKYIQDDVNLIDILDQITDGVMAGIARSGSYRQGNISPDLLMKAYNNTVKLLLSQVQIEE
jgi:hypothetical protein